MKLKDPINLEAITVPFIPLTGVGCSVNLIPRGLICTMTSLFSRLSGALILPKGVSTKEPLTFP